MKRSAAPEDQPALLRPHGVPPKAEGPPERQCSGCRTSTLLSDLATYGNRCKACYASWCNAASNPQRPIVDKRVAGPLGWACSIVERSKDGQSITQAQLDMARRALAVGVPKGIE